MPTAFVLKTSNKEKSRKLLISIKAWSSDMCRTENYQSETIPKKYLDYFSNKVNPKFCRVATVDEEGRPFVAAFRFAYDEKHIVFCSFSNRYTIRNIENNPNLSVIVDRNDEHPTSYCTMRGIAEIKRGGEELDRLVNIARTTNPGLDNLIARSKKGEYNKGGDFLAVSVEVREIFSRMI